MTDGLPHTLRSDARDNRARILDAARAKLETGGRRTVLFIDEIHRFNRAQQDILLGDVEAGLIILIGATTENPFFAVNSALVSRSQIFQFQAITLDDIKATVNAFADAAIRADKAGFDMVEIHAAHGYLINQFLSPLANHRTDQYGGSRANRMRFALEVVDAVRAAWPAHKPLFVRISATDAAEGGWDVPDSVVLAGELKSRGVDAVHVSSGGVSSYGLKAAPLYQVPLAKAVRDAGIATVAVGLISDPNDAEMILETGEADLIAFARGALEDPNWPIHAHHVLDGGEYDLWPIQARERIRGKDKVLGIRQA